MEEGILDIELVDRPGAGGSNAEYSTDGGWFNHRIERLIIINALALSEAANHPTGLITRQGTVGVELVAEYPLASYHIDTCRLRNQRPSRILK